MCGIVFAVRSSTSDCTSGNPSFVSSVDFPAASNGSAPDPDSHHALGLEEATSELQCGALPNGEEPDEFLEVWAGLVEGVKGRGPDAHNTITKHLHTSSKSSHFELRFHASILHMRGDDVTVQPFTADNGDVLLWNGEVFDGLEVDSHENDGKKLFDRIQLCGPSSFSAAIRDVEGPYAFVYYEASTQCIYFARDPLGRRSLLFHRPTPQNPFFLLTSAAPGKQFTLQDWEEVGCEAVHCYYLPDVVENSHAMGGKRGLSAYTRYPRSSAPTPDSLIYPFDRLNVSLPEVGSLVPATRSFPPYPVVPSELALLIQSFLAELERAVHARVSTVPPVPAPPDARVAVLFSGGLDCTTVALVADRVLPAGEAIDLINVAFENPRKQKAKEAEAGKAGGRKGKKGGKGKGTGRAPQGDGEVGTDGAELRPFTPPIPSASPALPEVSPHPSASQALPTDFTAIHPLSPSTPPPPASGIYDVPDRLTARSSWEELKRLRPDRDWRLVEVDVPYAEMLEHRQAVIGLMKPQKTVMDLNWCALLSELQLDLDRLPTRNLGRDDRIVSSHGKEARYPFLAGHVVDFLARQPVWLKADLRFAEGTGDKMLLRLLAKQLGLREAAGLKKRAIHFGAQTAKMEEGTSGAKGTDLLD
ncbi:hypothetical protein JCM10213v2_006720 [Rhodosporidiobolus nylandii]